MIFVQRLVTATTSHYLRDAPNPSHAITAATKQAIPLTNNGMGTPFTVTSHANSARNNCKSAMTAKMMAASRE
jgi:hypothetical protein